MKTQKIILKNIRILMNNNNLNSYKDLALFTNINENTIKSWFALKHIPRIKNLDIIADSFQLETFYLFMREPTINSSYFIKNQSKQILRINFLQLLRSTYGSSKTSDVLIHLNNIMSRDAYISYTRESDNRAIPINMLELLSKKFSIEIYLFFKEGGITEWLNNQK